MSETILRVEGIHTFIGRHHILQGISFAAKAESVTVLIGRNGAGKSTLLRTVMGLLPPSEGRILYHEQEVHNRKPYDMARMGIAFIPEDRGIFSNLTVAENMRIAMLVEDEKTGLNLERTLDLFTDLKRFWNAKAGTLSGGQKQMLSIARAMVNDAALLLVDEPSKGLAPILVERLIQTINEMKEKSAVVLVEQNFYMASRVGDDFYVIDDGRSVHSGVMEDFIHDDQLKSRYLGISKTVN